MHKHHEKREHHHMRDGPNFHAVHEALEGHQEHEEHEKEEHHHKRRH